MQKEIEELKAANKKLEHQRLREKEYSARLEGELDKYIKGRKKQ
jgi:hypothetical protein